MYKVKHPNNVKLFREMDETLAEVLCIDNSKLPVELADLRQEETSVAHILRKLNRKEKEQSKAARAKARKVELAAMHAREEIPTLTIEEESRRSRCEEAFYGLLVKRGIYETITEDDLL